jgi:UDP-3-O-[3-hydroxymyristoyl] glucosamine N-acyltransferase
MKLNDFFDKKEVIRGASFSKTMYPKTDTPHSLCYAAKQLHLDAALNNDNISAIITTEELSSQATGDRGLVVARDPKRRYYELHNYLVKNNLIPVHKEHSIHPSARIAPTAVIGERVVIGKDVVIGHHACIGDYTIIGEGTYVGEHVVIGTRGMQDTSVDGINYPVLYAGGVKIGMRCEILAGAIIQKMYHSEYTIVSDDCKISVKAVVGHGGRIGRGSMIAGSAQLSGNVVVGEGVVIGPSAVIADGVRIGDHAQIKLGSSVVEDVKPHQKVSGCFAVDHTQQLRYFVRMKNGQL